MRPRLALVLPVIAAALACGGSDDSGAFTGSPGAGNGGSGGSLAGAAGLSGTPGAGTAGTGGQSGQNAGFSGSFTAGASGSGAQAGLGGSAGAPVCVPGQQVACPCPGGSQGAQACRQDGTGYEPCVCPMGMGGSAGASGGAGAAGCPSSSGWFQDCSPDQYKHCFSPDCAAYSLNTPKCILDEQWAGHKGTQGNGTQSLPPTIGNAFVICY